MILCVLHSFDRCGFESLIGVSEFFDAFLVRVFSRGEFLWIAGLTGAVRADLVGIFPEFIELRLIVLRVT